MPGYYDLLSILKTNAQRNAQDVERLQDHPSDCPKCGTVLKTSFDGELFCPWDGWKLSDGYIIP